MVASWPGTRDSTTFYSLIKVISLVPLFHCIQYQSQEVPCYNNAYTLLRGNKAPPQPPSG